MRGGLIYGECDFKHIPITLSNPKKWLIEMEVNSQEVMSQRNLAGIPEAKVQKLVNRGNP
jgi:hypothetical protein